MKKYLLISLIVIAVLVLSACSSNLTNDITGEKGELALFLADKPVNNVDKVLVTISEVQVIRTDSGKEVINDFADVGGEMQFDLMNLRFDETLLGQKSLPAGQYEQIRLIVAAEEEGGNGNGMGNGSKTQKSKVVYKDDTPEDSTDNPEEPIYIPSSSQTGLKINHNFTIEDGVITRLVLDTDVSTIMHQTGSGKIMLRPTAVNVIDKVVSGNIEGMVLADTGNGTSEPITDSDVVVEAWKNGEIVNSTVALTEDYTEVNEETGEEITKPAGTFFLRGLIEGTYTLKAYVADNEGNIDDTSNYKIATMESVKVEADQTKKLEQNIILEQKVTTGSIEGNIAADTDNDGTFEAITDSVVMVQAIQNNEVVKEVTASPGDQNSANHFIINDLEEGTYSLKAYVADSNGNIDENTFTSKTVENISVTADSNNQLNDRIILDRVN